MSRIRFKIITPERIVFEDEVDQATLPTAEGEITVLPNHIPLISVLKSGELIVKKGGEEIDIAVSGGIIEVQNNEITILADTAERAEEIDVKRAEEAKKRAEELKSKRILADETQYAIVAANLEKNLARIKVAQKYMRRKGMRISG